MMTAYSAPQPQTGAEGQPLPAVACENDVPRRSRVDLAERRLLNLVAPLDAFVYPYHHLYLLYLAPGSLLFFETGGDAAVAC